MQVFLFTRERLRKGKEAKVMRVGGRKGVELREISTLLNT